MDWSLFWSSVGGAAAALTFLLTLFIEWPRFKARWAESASTKISLQIPILLVGVVGMCLYGASVVLGNKTSPLGSETIGKPGFLLMLASMFAMVVHAVWTTVTERMRAWYTLLALASLFLLTLVGIWSYFHIY
jgi:uncharacterized membrane protein